MADPNYGLQSKYRKSDTCITLMEVYIFIFYDTDVDPKIQENH
jgi:hypothetical protein